MIHSPEFGPLKRAGLGNRWAAAGSSVEGLTRLPGTIPPRGVLAGMG
jgi:hypothetical protein